MNAFEQLVAQIERGSSRVERENNREYITFAREELLISSEQASLLYRLNETIRDARSGK